MLLYLLIYFGIGVLVVAWDYRWFYRWALWRTRYLWRDEIAIKLAYHTHSPMIKDYAMPGYVREKKYFTVFLFILLWPIKLAFQPKITGFFRNVGDGRGTLLQNTPILLGFGQPLTHVSEVEKNTLTEISPDYSSKNRSVDLGESESEFDGDEESDIESDEEDDSDLLDEELDEIEEGLLATDPENPLEYVQKRMKEKWGDIYTDEEIEELAYVFAKEHTIKHGISDKSMGRMVQKAFKNK